MLEFEGFCWYDKVVFVSKVFSKEVENHVAALAVIAWVHGHLSEEVLASGHDDSKCAKSVPEVVEGEERL